MGIVAKDQCRVVNRYRAFKTMPTGAERVRHCDAWLVTVLSVLDQHRAVMYCNASVLNIRCAEAKFI